MRSIGDGVALNVRGKCTGLCSAPLICRGAGHVQWLDCLENFGRLDDEDVPVFGDKNASGRLRALIHVRREAIMLQTRRK